MSRSKSLLLLGRDFTELGPLEVIDLPDGGALALSRGAHPKPYRHVDPNEDAAFLIRKAEGAILAVADGHNGVRASELAIEAVQEHAVELISAADEGFPGTVRQLVRLLTGKLGEAIPSRTCLALVTLRETECRFALFGDCSVWRAGQERPLTISNDLILGPSLDLAESPAVIWSGHFERAPGERIAIVSDGITNFVPDPTRIHVILEEAESDAAAARLLAETAMTGGAGDNVAVATLSGLASPEPV